MMESIVVQSYVCRSVHLLLQTQLSLNMCVYQTAGVGATPKANSEVRPPITQQRRSLNLDDYKKKRGLIWSSTYTHCSRLLIHSCTMPPCHLPWSHHGRPLCRETVPSPDAFAAVIVLWHWLCLKCSRNSATCIWCNANSVRLLSQLVVDDDFWLRLHTLTVNHNIIHYRIYY